MNLKLITVDRSALYTQGQLEIDDVFECQTLELPYTDGRPGSALDPGTYRIYLDPSPKFIAVGADPDRDPIYTQFVRRYAFAMPHIEAPGRSLLMFHWGDEVKDTDGCTLVGMTWRSAGVLGLSRPAFAHFYGRIYDSVRADDCSLTVTR